MLLHTACLLPDYELQLAQYNNSKCLCSLILLMHMLQGAVFSTAEAGQQNACDKCDFCVDTGGLQSQEGDLCSGSHMQTRESPSSPPPSGVELQVSAAVILNERLNV